MDDPTFAELCEAGVIVTAHKMGVSKHNIASALIHGNVAEMLDILRVFLLCPPNHRRGEGWKELVEENRERLTLIRYRPKEVGIPCTMRVIQTQPR